MACKGSGGVGAAAHSHHERHAGLLVAALPGLPGLPAPAEPAHRQPPPGHLGAGDATRARSPCAGDTQALTLRAGCCMWCPQLRHCCGKQASLVRCRARVCQLLPISTSTSAPGRQTRPKGVQPLRRSAPGLCHGQGEMVACLAAGLSSTLSCIHRHPALASCSWHRLRHRVCVCAERRKAARGPALQGKLSQQGMNHGCSCSASGLLPLLNGRGPTCALACLKLPQARLRLL